MKGIHNHTSRDTGANYYGYENGKVKELSLEDLENSWTYNFDGAMNNCLVRINKIVSEIKQQTLCNPFNWTQERIEKTNQVIKENIIPLLIKNEMRGGNKNIVNNNSMCILNQLLNLFDVSKDNPTINEIVGTNEKKIFVTNITKLKEYLNQLLESFINDKKNLYTGIRIIIKKTLNSITEADVKFFNYTTQDYDIISANKLYKETKIFEEKLKLFCKPNDHVSDDVLNKNVELEEVYIRLIIDRIKQSKPNDKCAYGPKNKTLESRILEVIVNNFILLDFDRKLKYEIVNNQLLLTGLKHEELVEAIQKHFNFDKKKKDKANNNKLKDKLDKYINEGLINLSKIIDSADLINFKLDEEVLNREDVINLVRQVWVETFNLDDFKLAKDDGYSKNMITLKNLLTNVKHIAIQLYTSSIDIKIKNELDSKLSRYVSDKLFDLDIYKVINGTLRGQFGNVDNLYTAVLVAFIMQDMCNNYQYSLDKPINLVRGEGDYRLEQLIEMFEKNNVECSKGFLSTTKKLKNAEQFSEVCYTLYESRYTKIIIVYEHVNRAVDFSKFIKLYLMGFDESEVLIPHGTQIEITGHKIINEYNIFTAQIVDQTEIVDQKEVDKKEVDQTEILSTPDYLNQHSGSEIISQMDKTKSQYRLPEWLTTKLPNLTLVCLQYDGYESLWRSLETLFSKSNLRGEFIEYRVQQLQKEYWASENQESVITTEKIKNLNDDVKMMEDAAKYLQKNIVIIPGEPVNQEQSFKQEEGVKIYLGSKLNAHNDFILICEHNNVGSKYFSKVTNSLNSSKMIDKLIIELNKSQKAEYISLNLDRFKEIITSPFKEHDYILPTQEEMDKNIKYAKNPITPDYFYTYSLNLKDNKGFLNLKSMLTESLQEVKASLMFLDRTEFSHNNLYEVAKEHDINLILFQKQEINIYFGGGNPDQEETPKDFLIYHYKVYEFDWYYEINKNQHTGYSDLRWFLPYYLYKLYGKDYGHIIEFEKVMSISVEEFIEFMGKLEECEGDLH